MKRSDVFTLTNGLQCSFQYKKSTVAHIAVAIKAGSRDELKHQQGLAHFIEHNLFKGTKNRKAYHILSRLDDVGGELNAYTTKEETIIHASFLKRDLRRAVELLSDVLIESTFPERELAKEKEVIKDEIFSYKDTPSERIFDDFEDLIFEGNGLGRNILGTPESVDGLSRNDILEFKSRTYTAERIKIAVTGPYGGDRITAILGEHFGGWSLTENQWSAETMAHSVSRVSSSTNASQPRPTGPAVSRRRDMASSTAFTVSLSRYPANQPWDTMASKKRRLRSGISPRRHSSRASWLAAKASKEPHPSAKVSNSWANTWSTNTSQTTPLHLPQWPLKMPLASTLVAQWSLTSSMLRCSRMPRPTSSPHMPSTSRPFTASPMKLPNAPASFNPTQCPTTMCAK